MNRLDDFNSTVREESLLTADKSCETIVKGSVNLHTHTFFSYNALGWSPTHYALQCRKGGVEYAGIIDFDTLEGLEEFYKVGELLSLKTSVGFETRSFYNRYKNLEIDSPGEPGVHYLAGAGFYKVPEKGTEEDLYLAKLQTMAEQRNRALLDRINTATPELNLNYDTDVLPLSPGGTPTERHIIAAYRNYSEKNLSHKTQVSLWAQCFKMKESEIENLLKDKTKLEDQMRTSLAKKGGVAYVQPDQTTFPATEEVFAWIKACDAIPTESWLDGTSDGEKLGLELMESSVALGARALNIIPDRNWNIADEEQKKIKIENLNKVIANAVLLDLPLHIGTEGNKLGLPFVDDLNVEALKAHKEHFIKGAQVITGHVILGRFADYSYLSEGANNEFSNTKAKNDFFASVGSLPALNKPQADHLRSMDEEIAFAKIVDSATTGDWCGIK